MSLKSFSSLPLSSSPLSLSYYTVICTLPIPLTHFLYSLSLRFFYLSVHLFLFLMCPQRIKRLTRYSVFDGFTHFTWQKSSSARRSPLTSVHYWWNAHANSAPQLQFQSISHTVYDLIMIPCVVIWLTEGVFVRRGGMIASTEDWKEEEMTDNRVWIFPRVENGRSEEDGLSRSWEEAWNYVKVRRSMTLLKVICV